MKFRKKPVVIEAVQWDGGNIGEVRSHFGPFLEWSFNSGRDEVHIFTLEGTMTTSKGDWIIKGVKGEFYPCKPDIFAATYDAVHDA